jgi:hypothetical protein
MMGQAAAASRSRSLTWVWQVLGLIFAIFVVEQDIEYTLRTAHLHPGSGVLGVTFTAAPKFAPGYLKLSAVAPNSPMAKAGAQVGDHIRFDRPADWQRPLRKDETLGLTLDHAGVQRHLVVTTVTGDKVFSADDRAFTLGLGLSNILPALVGGFIIWRSGGRGAALLLGLSLVGFAKASPGPEPWLSTPETYPPLMGLCVVALIVTGGFFLAFPLRFYEETVGPLKRWVWPSLLATMALAGLANVPASVHYLLTAQALPVLGDGFFGVTVGAFAAMAGSLAAMILGWRRARPEAQKRYALLLIAFGMIVAIQGVLGLFAYVDPTLVGPKSLFAWVTIAVQGVIAPGLFAYAILRNKVFDLSFALNRTLVFGVVSAILLVAFGLSEWALDKLVHIESRETNALLDGGLALGVFLAFHHVHRFVEQVVERLFFRHWHEKEAALKSFARQSPAFEKSEALVRAFVVELQAFGDGAEAALYLRGAAGDYELTEGELARGPRTIEADDPVLVLMRTDRGPAEVAATRSTLPATLALPMIHGRDLKGFVLLGPKPGGLEYRPDEKTALAAVTAQVGTDMDVLRMEQLEQSLASLRAADRRLEDALLA